MLVINHANTFSSLLRRVHLGGIIGECVVNIEEGSVTIEALDCSNSVFVHASAKVADEGSTVFGLSNISTLSRFLDKGEDAQLDISKKKGSDADWLVAKRKGHGSVRLLLTDVEEIPTNVNDDRAKDNILKTTKVVLPLKETICNRLVELISLVGASAIQLTSKGGTIKASAPRSDPQQFETSLGKVTKGKGKDFSVKVFTEHLLPVLKELDFGDSKKPKLLLGAKSPVVIQQNKNSCWALMPVQSEE